MILQYISFDIYLDSNINYLFEQKAMVEEFFEKSPRIQGILPTMFDRRTTVAQQALEAVKQKFSAKCRIFEPIGVDSAVKKAQVKKLLIYDFKESKAAQSYRKVTNQLAGIM